RRYRLHRLHRQRQPIEKARSDQERGEAKEHTRRSETSDGHRPDDVWDERAKIAARIAAFQEKSPCWRARGRLRHRTFITRSEHPRPCTTCCADHRAQALCKTSL